MILSHIKSFFGLWILIIALLSSSVSAQGQTFGGTIILFLINAVIVGIILFILQSFLIKDTNPKEMTATYAIIIAASLLIAFLFGRDSLIFFGPLRIFFDYHVIANAIIIAIAIYFLQALLKVNEKLGLQSPEGKTGYTILIFGLSVILAIQLGPYWIWEQRTVASFVDYFFGQYGVFNPSYGLPVFLGSFFLLTFFFNSYLLPGGVGDKKGINYGLAFLFAMSMARGGTSLSTVIIIGELVFVLVMQKALATGSKWWDWLLSILIIGWASSAVSASMYDAGGTVYQGILGGTGLFLYKGLGGAGLIGGALGIFAFLSILSGGTGILLAAAIALIIYFWKLKSGESSGSALKPALITFGIGSLIALIGVPAIVLGLILLPILLIGGGTAFAITRGEEREGIWKAFKERNFTRLWNELKTRFQRRSSQIGVMTKWDIPEGLEPKSFTENRLLLFALLDYSLRLDIFLSKRYLFDKVKTPKMSQLWTDLVRYYDRKRLRMEISNYRSGTNIASFAPIGWAVFDKQLLDNMRRILELMYSSLRIARENPPTLSQDLANIAQEMININTNLNRLAESAETCYGNFEGRYEPYGVWHHIRSLVLNIYDMYNVFGVYEHDYMFPRAGAKFRANIYEVPTDPAAISNLPDASQDIEVNMFGYDVERINRKQPLTYPPRKLLNPRSQSDFYRESPEITLPNIMSWLSNEWRGFVEDFRRGVKSPNSRTVQDYSLAMSRLEDVHMNDDAVAKGEPGIAFDRRTFVNPGLWRYWGRMHYYGGENDVVMGNPYPRLTMLGMQSYLEALIRLRERDPERVINDFLNSYPLDLEREVATEQDLQRAIGRFREKKAT